MKKFTCYGVFIAGLLLVQHTHAITIINNTNMPVGVTTAKPVGMVMKEYFLYIIIPWGYAKFDYKAKYGELFFSYNTDGLVTALATGKPSEMMFTSKGMVLKDKEQYFVKEVAGTLVLSESGLKQPDMVAAAKIDITKDVANRKPGAKGTTKKPSKQSSSTTGKATELEQSSQGFAEQARELRERQERASSWF